MRKHGESWSKGSGVKLKDFIKRLDPNGEGGALLDGVLWRQSLPVYSPVRWA
jgi:hypothetical protein